MRINVRGWSSNFFQGSQCSECLHGSKGELRGKKGGAEGSWVFRVICVLLPTNYETSYSSISGIAWGAACLLQDLGLKSTGGCLPDVPSDDNGERPAEGENEEGEKRGNGDVSEGGVVGEDDEDADPKDLTSMLASFDDESDLPAPSNDIVQVGSPVHCPDSPESYPKAHTLDEVHAYFDELRAGNSPRSMPSPCDVDSIAPAPPSPKPLPTRPEIPTVDSSPETHVVKPGKDKATPAAPIARLKGFQELDRPSPDSALSSKLTGAQRDLFLKVCRQKLASMMDSERKGCPKSLVDKSYVHIDIYMCSPPYVHRMWL